jgi:hypothetical protein
VEIHAQGMTTYKKLPCHVEMAFLIPQDIKKHHWVFLWIKGLHPHPPPPPTKTPQDTFHKISKLMKSHNVLTLTRGK